MPGTKCPSLRRISASAGDRPRQPCWWGSKGRGNGNGTGGRSRPCGAKLVVIREASRKYIY
eukprot:929064-Pyramimonas_sp.AAC.1